MRMVSIALLCAAIVAGCGTIRPSTSACGLLAIALDEAEMAEAWYIETGDVLARCGMPNAAEKAAYKACIARRFNDSSVECKP